MVEVFKGDMRECGVNDNNDEKEYVEVKNKCI